MKNKSLGLSAEEIAKEEKVKPDAVRRSISDVEAYHALFNLKEMEAGQNEVLILNQRLETLAINSGLTAETIIRDKDGKIIAREPDHELRLKSVQLMISLVEALESRNKGGGGNQTVQVGISLPQATAGAQSFEDRLREISKKRSEEISSGVPALIEARPQEPVTEFIPSWEEDREAETESSDS